MIIPTKKGTMARLSCSIDTFDMLLATNKLTPSGCVQKPIAKLTVKMTPKTMGSTPNAVATGKIIGVMIMIDEIVSMNIPMTRSSTLINSKTIIGLSDRLVIKLANSVGCARA